MSRRRRRDTGGTSRRAGLGRRAGPVRRGTGGGGPRSSITITLEGPSGDVATSSPSIRANVRDTGGPIPRSNIGVYVDGESKRFDYTRATGNLRCSARNLSPGTHTVEIEASSDFGARTARKRWTINVKT